VLSSNGVGAGHGPRLVNTGLAFHRAEVVLSGVMENFIPAYLSCKTAIASTPIIFAVMRGS
jgi:hypothetical protein